MNVCCVMLVDGREAMVRRAIASFRAQTYERKRLLILDSGIGRQEDNRYGASDVTTFRLPGLRGETIGALRNAANWCASEESGKIASIRLCADSMESLRGETIGALRNAANWCASAIKQYGAADLIAHFDSDDWSHPSRLQEQVALLEESGKMCVGYGELLFWDTRPLAQRGEAWIYHNHDPRWAAGASFLYRRELWEQQPFPDVPHEDQRWWCTPLVSSNCVATSITKGQPRMICGIHGSNTENYDRSSMERAKDTWRRAPEYDEYCSVKMRMG